MQAFANNAKLVSSEGIYVALKTLVRICRMHYFLKY